MKDLLNREISDNEFEEAFIEQYDCGKRKFDGEVVTRLVHCYEVDSSQVSGGRWSATIRSICEVKGRFFAVNWLQGLTEMQPNEYDVFNDVEEVKLVKKIIEIEEWVSK